MEHYLFVVDTNEATESFYQQMCAYVTGFVDEGGLGTALSVRFLDELHVENPDDYYQKEFGRSSVVLAVSHKGRYRVAVPYSSNYYWHDGLGNLYPYNINPESEEVQQNWKTSLRALNLPVEDHRDLLERGIQKERALNSMAVYLSDLPTKKEFEFWRERTRTFCQNPTSLSSYIGPPDRIVVLGYRIIRQYTLEENIPLSRLK